MAIATNKPAVGEPLERLLDKMGHFPSSPKILPPLLRALGQDDADLNQVVDLITLDAGLTVRLLTTSNCAAYGLAANVESVAAAIHHCANIRNSSPKT